MFCTRTLLPLAATLTALFSLHASTAHSQTRIATVDVAKILNESPDAAAKKKDLDAISQEAKKKAEAKLKDLKALEAKLKEAKVSPDSKEAENFRTQAREYERFVKDTEEDIKKRFVKVNKEMTDKALAKIEAYAKSNKLDLVLDKSEKYRGPVLFGVEAADITDSVIETLGD
jgi:Skp family chaperone for outer membrane proteins